MSSAEVNNTIALCYCLGLHQVIASLLNSQNTAGGATYTNVTFFRQSSGTGGYMCQANNSLYSSPSTTSPSSTSPPKLQLLVLTHLAVRPVYLLLFGSRPANICLKALNSLGEISVDYVKPTESSIDVSLSTTSGTPSTAAPITELKINTRRVNSNCRFQQTLSLLNQIHFNSVGSPSSSTFPQKIQKSKKKVPLHKVW
ncbi:hypothetical protein EI94DRAFT_1707821 [Lactarius quietus]|nr:hypothetical protein EI94DRAFT_1707821 [Lactarius quietus]